MYDMILLVKLGREFAGDDLLKRTFEASGQAMSVNTVSAFFRFVVEKFGRDESSAVTKKFWAPVAYYLASNGVSKAELAKLRRPFPVYGEPGFKSIFDEMLEKGEISQEDFDDFYSRGQKHP